MVSDWEKLINGTKELVSLLEEEKIYDYERLPTETVLAPLSAIFAIMPDEPDIKGKLRAILKKYLWRAFFTERYDRSIPTRILQDYRAIKRLIDGEGKAEEIPIFDEKKYPLPNEELLIGAGWPKKKDRLARAILLLSLRKGAIDFADRSPVDRKNIRVREYHHLYPIDFLKKKGFEDKDSYKSLNCALITWKTNRIISNKDPLTYLIERAEASGLGEEEIKNRLSTHLIDYDKLKNGDYQDFIEKRAESIKELMEKLCRGDE